MTFERVDIGALQLNVNAAAQAPLAEGLLSFKFLDTIRRLFDDTIDHFIVTFTLKQRKSTIHMYRQSLTVRVESPDGGEAREIAVSYSILSQPVRDDADSKRRNFLTSLFSDAEKQMETQQCQVMVKKKGKR
jgi:hypothetical protein